MLYLYGAGGHAKVIIEIAERTGFVIAGLIDMDPDITDILGYPVTTVFPEAGYDGNGFMVSIGNNSIRKRIAESSELTGKYFETLVHPFSAVSARALVGDGTVIMAGAVINADTQVGRHCIINTNASIEHDCVLGDYVHISPGASLAGNVQIGEGTHIGIGASIIQGVRIGSWCTIGAGAVIIRDVPDGATVVGNPGRIISTK